MKTIKMVDEYPNMEVEKFLEKLYEEIDEYTVDMLLSNPLWLKNAIAFLEKYERVITPEQKANGELPNVWKLREPRNNNNNSAE